MSTLAAAHAAHRDAEENGTRAEADAANKAAIAAWRESTEAEKDAVFPNRPKP